MIYPEKVLKGFRVTEKATEMQSANKYVFSVEETSNAVEIGQAVEKLFKVKVEKVNVLNVKGKVKRSRTSKAKPGVKGKMKKAIVTLKAGESIQMA